MLDQHLRRVVDPLLNLLVAPLAGRVTPNQLTLGGFVIGLIAVPLLAVQAYNAALVCILLNRLLDGLDGALARRTLSSDFGGFLDIVCDFIFYAAVVAGFGLAQPNFAWVSLLLITSFVGTGTSFMAFAALAEKRGISQAGQQRKAIHYLSGLTEGSETIGFFVLCCLLPNWFWLLGCIFAGLCWATTLSRCVQAGDKLR